MSSAPQNEKEISRRDFVQSCALGALAFAAAPMLRAQTPRASAAGEGSGPATRVLELDRDWLFGGKFNPAATAPQFDDAAFTRVSLPHCVAKLGWQNWDPALWQDVWIYRRHFTLPPDFAGRRVFLHFDGVLVGATPTINGHTLPQHLGGYLPFRYEVTQWLRAGDNVLAVAVDARWSQVPPQGNPKGHSAQDFLEAGGIYRAVRIEAVPAAFIADVFAKPVRVLDADRRVEVTCSLDASALPAGEVRIRTELQDGTRVMAHAERTVRLEKTGANDFALTLSKLGDVALWTPDTPKLYRVVTTLIVDGRPVHDYVVRIGFRTARFEMGGFFLNGKRFQLFGLNRHELFPYAAFALPRRAMRRDAQILRRDLNCNIVRCSHYPQTPDFLDACDELGLMVFEEMPGWQFIGDAAWQELAIRDMGDMVRRDRNRPAIVLWGARINESRNVPPFYEKVRAVCNALDDSRQTSGAMSSYSLEGWAEDVFAKNDYHAPADILAPLDAPYVITETVGQFNYAAMKGFDARYYRAGDLTLQRGQAIYHARGHNNAAANPRIAGVVAWCAFEYPSQRNPVEGVKTPGVSDLFRIPKLGATFYLAQCDAKTRPVIAPNFYWDFGPRSPRGPGKESSIFSNCERLEVFIDSKRHATLRPDTKNYPHLKHAPFFVDLELDGAKHPELRLDGYVGDKVVLSRKFSSDPAHDRFAVAVDDAALTSAEPDVTRIEFKVVDTFGADRAFATGRVTFDVSGPAELVGINPFQLEPAGGAGAVWLRTIPGKPGRVTVRVRHDKLGERSVTVEVRSDVRVV